MYNLLLATLTVKVHFMTFRVERILTEITYYFKKIIKNSLQPLYYEKAKIPLSNNIKPAIHSNQ